MNIVADETYVGGKVSNKSNTKRKEFAETKNNWAGKTGVLGIFEREGELRTIVILKDAETRFLDKEVRRNVEYASTVVTDSVMYYKSLNDDYYHHTVNHGLNEYVRYKFHTNSIEGVFSHFKRMIIGTYHQLSAKHLHRYCDEFTYRFNSRKIKDADRFNITLKRVQDKLPYKTLVYGEINKEIGKKKATKKVSKHHEIHRINASLRI